MFQLFGLSEDMFGKLFRLMPDIDHMEIALSQNSSFQKLLRTDKSLSRFKDLLSLFLRDVFFLHRDTPPRRIEFTIFQDPETTIERPMVEIFLQSGKKIQRDELQRDFISRFKEYLSQNAKDADDFIALRQEQRHFMIIFTFE
nr:hypothetical protein [Candidatus Sigynarchaeota archaeon]